MPRNFSVIRILCAELYRVKTGVREPRGADIKRVQDFWIKFMGFHRALEMTEEDMRSLEKILISRINGERRRLGLPRIFEWFEL